jgi:hypothetical protein
MKWRRAAFAALIFLPLGAWPPARAADGATDEATVALRARIKERFPYDPTANRKDPTPPPVASDVVVMKKMTVVQSMRAQALQDAVDRQDQKIQDEKFRWFAAARSS